MTTFAAILRRPPGSHLLLAAFALILFLPGIASLPPVDRDEARFAQATRQMLETGNLVDIRFQDEPRYKKPIGIYWLQAAAVRLTGGDPAAPAIWRYRLPSLGGAVAAVLLTAWIGRLLFTPEAGLLAGAMLAAAPLLGIEARFATTDAVLLALTLVAVGALARAYLAWAQPAKSPPSGPGNAALFWIAVGGGLLIKGPAILLVVGTAALALALVERRSDWLLALRPLPGTILALAIALPWFIAIMARSDGSFAEESLGRDFLSKLFDVQESHTGPPGYYFGTAFAGFWPFALPTGLAIFAIARARRQPTIRFCLAWLLPTWLLLELVATKLPHYALPLYPALALLGAQAILRGWVSLDSLEAGWQRGLGTLNLAVVIVITLVIASIGLWLPRLLGAAIDLWAWPAFIGVAAAGAAGALSVASGRTAAGIAAMLTASAIASPFVFGRLLPGLDALWPSRTVADAVRAYAHCPAPMLASAGYEEPSLVFLLGTGTRLTSASGAADALAQDPVCTLALVTEDTRAAFDARLAAAGQKAAVVAQFDGFDFSKGAWQRLTLHEAAP